MKDLLKKIVFYLLTALLVVTPLLSTSFTEESYEFPKMFFVYFIVSTAAFLYFLYKLLFTSTPKFAKIPKLIIIYFSLNLISTIFSIDSYTSWWGYYSRFNGGMVSLIIFIFLYYLFANFLKQKSREFILDLSLFTLFPVTVYGLFQTLENTRIFSTLGQPNWLASYLVILIPLVVSKIISTKKLTKNFWIVVFLLSISNLFLTVSLSGIIGFGASLLYLVVSYKKYYKFIFGLILVIGLLAFKVDFINNRISDAFTFSTNPEDYKVSDSGLIRLGLWQGSLKLSTSNIKTFFIGTGPETFAYTFPFFRPSFLNYSSEWDFILNKPHNFYLEQLAEIGYLGLVSYISLMIYSMRIRNKYMKAGLIGFYVTNIFSWPTVVTSLFFWVFLSFIDTNTDT